MLSYEAIKKFKRDLMTAPDFIEGHGRLESVEFHTYEFVFLRGIEEGFAAAGMPDAEIQRILKLVR
ncbi:MAG: hypothetical protein WA085_13250 [Sphingobium sp.]